MTDGTEDQPIAKLSAERVDKLLGVMQAKTEPAPTPEPTPAPNLDLPACRTRRPTATATAPSWTSA